jgi:hypothetical protein
LSECRCAAADDVRHELDGLAAEDSEPVAEVIPECDAELAACLDEAKEDVAAVPASAAAGAAADMAFGDLTEDVVFRAAGVQGVSGQSAPEAARQQADGGHPQQKS